jgi:hypothetical protein
MDTESLEATTRRGVSVSRTMMRLASWADGRLLVLVLIAVIVGSLGPIVAAIGGWSLWWTPLLAGGVIACCAIVAMRLIGHRLAKHDAVLEEVVLDVQRRGPDAAGEALAVAWQARAWPLIRRLERR